MYPKLKCKTTDLVVYKGRYCRVLRKETLTPGVTQIRLADLMTGEEFYVINERPDR